MPAMDYAIILIIILFVALLLGKMFLTPMRWIAKLAINSAVGIIFLVALNFLGSPLGIHLPYNVVTVLTAGFLGFPGVILLLIVQFLF